MCPECKPGMLEGTFSLTVGELWVAELQVFAGPGWVVLGAHGVLHALDVLLEVVEGAEDVLHALAIVHHGFVGLVVAGALAPFVGADGQRLDHLAWGTLQSRQGQMGAVKVELTGVFIS